MLKIIYIQPNLNTVKKIFYKPCVSTHRYSLIKCIKIIIVKGQTNRQPFYNKCRKILAFTSPLLLGISFDKLFKYVTSHQRDSLFLKIFRFSLYFGTLLIYFCLCFFRSNNTPHFIKCVHIERKRIQLSLVICHRAVCETVEISKFCYVIPYLAVIGMKNMGTVFMDIYTLNFFCINIAADIGTFVNNKYIFPHRFGFLSKDSTVKPAAHY